VHGVTAIRTCIVTYRTEAHHLQKVLDKALGFGAALHESRAVA
jgi:hypothetical protein